MGKDRCEARGSESPGETIWGAEETAAFLGCTTGTLRVWVSQRRVPHYKVGGLVRFRREDLEEFLQSCRVSVSRAREERKGHANLWREETESGLGTDEVEHDR